MIDWLVEQHEIAGGRVALVDAVPGGNEEAMLFALPQARRHYCPLSSTKALAELGAATACAHTVVFYSNHGSSRSPSRAAAFAAWARGARPPGSRPRVCMVEGGVSALVVAGLLEVNKAVGKAAGE